MCIDYSLCLPSSQQDKPPQGITHLRQSKQRSIQCFLVTHTTLRHDFRNLEGCRAESRKVGNNRALRFCVHSHMCVCACLFSCLHLTESRLMNSLAEFHSISFKGVTCLPWFRAPSNLITAVRKKTFPSMGISKETQQTEIKLLSQPLLDKRSDSV